MPSPDDRLQELRRQRALVQEQLAWLDREIAAIPGEAASQPAAQSLPPVPRVESQPPAPAEDSDDLSEVIKSYQDESRSNPAKAYWATIWIFVAGLVLFALCILAFYLYVRNHQPPPVR